MISLAIAIFLIQDDETGYSAELTKDLKKVEAFLRSSDLIVTTASHRILHSYRQLEEHSSLLKKGQRHILMESPQFKSQNLTGKERQNTVKFFQELTRPPIQGPAKCFFPRHSIFARKNSDWIEILICYECCTFSIDSKDKSIQRKVGMNPNSRKSADKFFGFVSNDSKA